MGAIRVLVVDDSAAVRHIVAQVLDAEKDIDVVGTAKNGLIALEKLAELSPDAVTLDIEMPELDGLATLQRIRQGDANLPVIMFSTLTESGAARTLEALSLGASDYVTKPSNTTALTDSVRSVREQLLPKLRSLCTARPAAPAPARASAPATPRPGAPRPTSSARSSLPAGTPQAPAAGRVESTRTRTPARGATRTPARLDAAPEPRHRQPRPAARRPEVVVIGSSTGGPEALARVLGGLPPTLRVPVAVVQHMPPIFTRLLAERLDRSSPFEVREAQPGDVLRPGLVLIAPGDHHLELVRRGPAVVAQLTQAPPENFCRPAVDVLFRSTAGAYGGSALAVVLTGMGSDGRKGAHLLKGRGATVLAQDEATSVVWGMPGAVAQARLADAVLPLDDIPRAVADLVGAAPLATRPYPSPQEARP